MQVEDNEMQGVLSMTKRLPKVLQLIIGEQAHELNVFRLKEELLFTFWPPKWVTLLWIFQLQRLYRVKDVNAKLS